MNKNNVTDELNFFNVLNESSKRTVVVCNHEKLTGEEIHRDCAKIRNELSPNENYFLAVTNPLYFVLSLIALEKFANSIHVLPKELHDEEVSDISNRNTVFITDNTIKRILNCEINEKNNTFDLKKNTHWFLYTSGTTSSPKKIKHSLHTLAKSVKVNRSKARVFKWGLLYDFSRFAGLQVILQAILGWGQLIIPENETIADSVKLLKKYNCNSISATPSVWRKILMTPDAEQLKLINITLGGEICDQPILSRLKEVYPDAKLRHIYASTEAGVCFSVSDGLEGFPETYLAKFNLKVDSEGMLYIKSKKTDNQTSDNYLNSLIENGYLKTLDIVEKVGNRYKFLGRENGVINIGGRKVFPEKIEKLILQLEEVEAVVVKSKKSAFLGSIIYANVQLGATPLTQEEVKEKIFLVCRENLTSIETPYKINILKNMELTSSGKQKRNISQV